MSTKVAGANQAVFTDETTGHKSGTRADLGIFNQHYAQRFISVANFIDLFTPSFSFFTKTLTSPRSMRNIADRAAPTRTPPPDRVADEP